MQRRLGHFARRTCICFSFCGSPKNLLQFMAEVTQMNQIHPQLNFRFIKKNYMGDRFSRLRDPTISNQLDKGDPPRSPNVSAKLASLSLTLQISPFTFSQIASPIKSPSCPLRNQHYPPPFAPLSLCFLSPPCLVVMETQSQFHVLAVDDSIIDRKLIEKLLKTSSFHGMFN